MATIAMIISDAIGIDKQRKQICLLILRPVDWRGAFLAPTFRTTGLVREMRVFVKKTQVNFTRANFRFPT